MTGPLVQKDANFFLPVNHAFPLIDYNLGLTCITSSQGLLSSKNEWQNYWKYLKWRSLTNITMLVECGFSKNVFETKHNRIWDCLKTSPHNIYSLIVLSARHRRIKMSQNWLMVGFKLRNPWMGCYNNEHTIRDHFVTSSLVGWTHVQKYPCTVA